MSVSTGRARLFDAYKKLRQSWQRTSQTWRDESHAEFERQTMDLLDKQVRTSLNAMGQINEAIDKVRRECS
jgi:uncharacterized protein YukE